MQQKMLTKETQAKSLLGGSYACNNSNPKAEKNQSTFQINKKTITLCHRIYIFQVLLCTNIKHYASHKTSSQFTGKKEEKKDNKTMKYIIGFGVFCFAVGMWIMHINQPKGVIRFEENLLQYQWPEEIEFAGEKVPLDTFYVREAWERDFIVLLDTDYQSLLYLKRSGQYFPFIEEKLKEAGLPDDLKYIAVAESGLRNTVVSHAGAAGVWQFMPATARQYGLRVDEYVDERLHFEKSTEAAIRYLTYLHGIFENWTLSSAAYNAGENRILGHLNNQGVTSYYDTYMNDETARYVFRIMSIKQVMQNADDYGLVLTNADMFSFPKQKTVNAEEISDLSVWAREQGTNLRMIKELNPWIIGSSLPLGNWELKVPLS